LTKKDQPGIKTKGDKIQQLLLRAQKMSQGLGKPVGWRRLAIEEVGKQRNKEVKKVRMEDYKMVRQAEVCESKNLLLTSGKEFTIICL
jgi:hypothetical protein